MKFFMQDDITHLCIYIMEPHAHEGPCTCLCGTPEKAKKSEV
jgi:hypothetical protein